jgi:hypothetical protein
LSNLMNHEVRLTPFLWLSDAVRIQCVGVVRLTPRVDRQEVQVRCVVPHVDAELFGSGPEHYCDPRYYQRGARYLFRDEATGWLFHTPVFNAIPADGIVLRSQRADD